MEVRGANVLDVDEGVYYNPEKDILFTLENRKFRMCNGLRNTLWTYYMYDVYSEFSVEIGVVIPWTDRFCERIGDL